LYVKKGPAVTVKMGRYNYISQTQHSVIAEQSVIPEMWILRLISK
jgi:hypothetical protein